MSTIGIKERHWSFKISQYHSTQCSHWWYTFLKALRIWNIFLSFFINSTLEVKAWTCMMMYWQLEELRMKRYKHMYGKIYLEFYQTLFYFCTLKPSICMTSHRAMMNFCNDRLLLHFVFLSNLHTSKKKKIIFAYCY